MSIRSSVPSVYPASRSDRPIVERLLQLYLHDFSGFSEADDPFGDTDDNGVFHYKDLETYWQQTEREPLLFQTGSHLAGFAFVNSWSASGRGTDRAIAEFFVLRRYRRIGLGTHAATEIVRRRPAVWEIAVADYNRPALLFWRSVVANLNGYESEEIDGDGQRWCGRVVRLTPNSK
ncbi:MAG: GNAT family N-acetyltransferase [Pseudomonadota bacterium]